MAMQRNKESGERDVGFTARPCPICGRPSSFAARPFCSKRCADIDLHRWFSGAYAVPAEPDAAEDEGNASENPGSEQK
ncbi:MAG TPA: DNA gyrase inhibitor YacG [Methylovirgula sp.]|nr:DNA gyrase inhibitor YacG [Methylovirgula sp.]